MAAGRQRLLKRWALLLAALALLGLAGSLMLGPAEQRRRRAALEFPHYPRPQEIERQQRRNTLLLKRPALAPPGTPEARPDTAAEEPTTELRLDPLHVALAGESIGVVIEAAALKDSPLGRMLLGCLSPEQSSSFAEWEQKLGVRLLEQVERVAISGNGEDEPVLILSGQLAGFDPSALGEGMAFEPYGARGRWAEHGDHALAAWEDQLLVLGAPEAVRGTLARLEAEPSPAATSLAAEAYGEVYGTLSGRAASLLLPSELRERFANATDRVSVHVDARDDLLLVADVVGPQADALRELASVIGGAFALGRLHAARSREPVLAELLDESRVIPGDGSFQIEMALPLATIAEQLGECALTARAR